jgi:hypothetical protein
MNNQVIAQSSLARAGKRRLLADDSVALKSSVIQKVALKRLLFQAYLWDLILTVKKQNL